MLFNVEYYHAPPREIDQAIAWLHDVIADCEMKIRKLESLKNADERQDRHKQKIKEITDLFDDPDFFGIDQQNQIEIIRQRLGCDYKRAGDIHALLLGRKKRRDKRTRREMVIKLRGEKVPVTQIAQRAGISRQAVYDILKKA